MAANTVIASLIACGVPLLLVFNGQSPAQRVSNDIFLDDFSTCLSISTDEVNDAFVAYTKLTVPNGRVPFQPGVKRRVIAFVQWVRNQIRCGIDPSTIPFAVGDVVLLLHQLQSVKTFITRSDLLAGQAKPKSFTKTTSWIDWEITFINYLKLIPGRIGVPLAYVLRRDVAPNPALAAPILEYYIANAPLDGEIFNEDSQQVLTLLLTFVTENTEIEAIIRTATLTDGRIAHQALVARFEGTGALGTDLIKAERNICELFYHGDRTCIGIGLKRN